MSTQTPQSVLKVKEQTFVTRVVTSAFLYRHLWGIKFSNQHIREVSYIPAPANLADHGFMS